MFRVTWMGKRLTVAALAVAVLVSAAALTGCSLLPFGRPSGDTGEAPVSPGPGEGEIVARLYFGDKEAMWLLPEDRTVKADPGKTYEQVVVEQLIAGPKLEGHVRTIPEGVQLLSLEIVEGVAYVNFSKEIQTKHWGGSTGEMFTIMSVVNSLTESPNVKAVQFLVEGKRVESLVGHADTTKPIERNEDLIKKGD
ncbi:MAG: GerMN domain-containing protein [Firmicutes bacterium]|nr:GerMN domain-containing protein [Bacillota bacterium]